MPTSPRKLRITSPADSQLRAAIAMYNQLCDSYEQHQHDTATAGGASTGAPTTTVAAGKIGDLNGTLSQMG